MKRRKSENTLNKKIQDLDNQKNILLRELEERQLLEAPETKKLLGELLINSIESQTISRTIINTMTNGIRLGKEQKQRLIKSGLLEDEAGCQGFHKNRNSPTADSNNHL